MSPVGLYRKFVATATLQAFVGCTLGIWKIGLVTLPYGVTNACVSMASGHVVKYTGRVPVFLLGKVCFVFHSVFSVAH